MNAYDVLQEMNRVIFARRFDEFSELLEKLADTDLLVHDENWILRYAVLVSPDKFFFNKAFEACVDNGAVLYDWMLEGPMFS